MNTGLVGESTESGDGVVEGDRDLHGVGNQVLDFSLFSLETSGSELWR